MIEARLSPDEREQIDRAAALTGESAFLVSAAVDRAEAIFEAAAVTVLPRDYFDELLATIEEPDPVPGLRRAITKAERLKHLQVLMLDGERADFGATSVGSFSS